MSLAIIVRDVDCRVCFLVFVCPGKNVKNMAKLLELGAFLQIIATSNMSIYPSLEDMVVDQCQRVCICDAHNCKIASN